MNQNMIKELKEHAEKWADANTSCEKDKLIAVAAYLTGAAQTLTTVREVE